MKVNVASILNTKGASIEAEGTENGESLFPEHGPDGLQLSEPIRIRVRFTNTGKYIVARGTIETLAQLRCSRCLDDFSMPVQVRLEEEFCKAAPRDSKHEELAEIREPDSFEDDCEEFRGDTIDLSDVVRQNILLALPMKSLCDPGCKGICPVCGANLNKGSCTCEQKAVDPRFVALSELFKSD